MERFDVQLSGDAADAVDRYIIGCTVPLVEELGDQAAILGTGNLFEFRHRCFLVSTSHSFADFDPERVGVLARTGAVESAFLTLNGCRRYYWDDADLDVTAIEIPPGALLDSLRRTYHFLDERSLARHGEVFGQYIVVGFPREAAATAPGRITPQAVKITTTPFLGQPPANFRADREFLLAFAEKGWTSDGETRESIPLPGMSGAAVWGVAASQSPGGLWSPSAAVRIVGVQHAYERTSYIRCHQWWLVARLLQQVDAGIGDDIITRVARPTAAI